MLNECATALNVDFIEKDPGSRCTHIHILFSVTLDQLATNLEYLKSRSRDRRRREERRGEGSRERSVYLHHTATVNVIVVNRKHILMKLKIKAKREKIEIAIKFTVMNNKFNHFLKFLSNVWQNVSIFCHIVTFWKSTIYKASGLVGTRSKSAPPISFSLVYGNL